MMRVMIALYMLFLLQHSDTTVCTAIYKLKTADACVIGCGGIALQILMNCMVCAELSCVMSIELALSHSWISNRLYVFLIKDFEH
jgi:hypothetical protein